MPNPFCPICNARLTGSLAYCSIRHRERAKYLRRKARDRGFLSPPANNIPRFWEDSLDHGTLTLLSETLEPDGEVWFADAKGFETWQAPSGFLWEVLADGKGRLKKQS